MSHNNLVKSLQTIEWMINNPALNLTVLGITGGEPTLHPEFWDLVIPTLANFRKAYPKVPIELHANASVLIPRDEFKLQYSKLFSKMYIGRDIFHDQFRKPEQLFLSDYEYFVNEIALRKNAYPVNDGRMYSLIKQKGRGADIKISPDRSRRLECACYTNSGHYALLTAFTPTHICFCGERAAKSVVIDNKVAMGYDYTRGEEVIEKAFYYNQLYSGKNCDQPCMADLVCTNDFINPALDTNA